MNTHQRWNQRGKVFHLPIKNKKVYVQQWGEIRRRGGVQPTHNLDHVRRVGARRRDFLIMTQAKGMELNDLSEKDPHFHG